MPAKESRLIVGLLAIKHMEELSDEEVLESVRENPYQQAFCGFDQLVTSKRLNEAEEAFREGIFGGVREKGL